MKLEINDETFMWIGGALAVAGIGYLVYANFLQPKDGSLTKAIAELPSGLPVTESNLIDLLDNDLLNPSQAAAIYADEVYRRDKIIRKNAMFSFSDAETAPMPKIV